MIEKFSSLVKSNRGPTLSKLKELLGGIIKHVIYNGKAKTDPTCALMYNYKVRHIAAATTPEGLTFIIRAFWDYSNIVTIRNALRILVYTFQRPCELISMKWFDIDFDRNQQKFILFKTGKQHIVPLACQVVALLNELTNKEILPDKANMSSPVSKPSSVIS